MANQLLNEDSKGVYVIAATPFADDGALDLESADSLVDFYLECRVHGMTVLGMMGEAPKLTTDEANALVDRVLARVAGRVPVVVGVSNPGLTPMRLLAERSMEHGAAGVMVAPQAGLQGDEAVLGYFRRVLNELGPDIPVCLQDFPPVTGVFVSVDVVGRLVDEFGQLVMFKHEDWPGLGKLTRIRAEAEAARRRRVSILTGNGGLFFPLELRRAADGAMTGFAYPEMLVEVYELFAAGKADAAEDLYDRYLPLIRYEQQPGFGLAVRKEILRRRGAIASAFVRPPGAKLTDIDVAEIDHLLTRIERRMN